MKKEKEIKKEGGGRKEKWEGGRERERERKKKERMKGFPVNGREILVGESTTLTFSSQKERMEGRKEVEREGGRRKGGKEGNNNIEKK